VQMIALHAELQDAEPAATRCRQSGSNRNEGNPVVARSVTWAGQCRSCGARRRWDMRRRPGAGLRPAPRRLPPQVRRGSSNCRGDRILELADIYHAKHISSSRGASRGGRPRRRHCGRPVRTICVDPGPGDRAFHAGDRSDTVVTCAPSADA
jgi:hypothetical protein